MSEHILTTLLTDELIVIVRFDYQPEEPDTLTYPGCGALVELNSVCVGALEIMPVLNQSALSDLANKCMESMCVR